MSNVFNTSQLKLAFDFAEYTGRHIFLTGKAGTGKTTFLHNFKEESSKRMIVVAPTGVAAINAGGVTIHSFFQLPFGPHLPEDIYASQGVSKTIQKMSGLKKDIIRNLDLLVIDEISMVRADLLDAIDDTLRRFKDPLLPFGGVQLLMIGDLQQLAPIVPNDEWALLKDYYETLFFFGSRALKQTNYISIELTHIFRQNDDHFICLLNKVRDNQIDEETLQALNDRYDPHFNPSDNEGYVTLTTHNKQAKTINKNKLRTIDSETHTMVAKIEDDFPKHAYPTDDELALKIGSQVMFVKNDTSEDKLFYNGKIGTVEKITDETIDVKCSGNSDVIQVKKMEWNNIKYTIDEENKTIKETTVGTFTQFPLKLAWAITIHKSQGLTFEKAIIDANAAFAHGQVYVALSRCKSLEGMVLISKISRECIRHDPEVLQFMHDIATHSPGNTLLDESRYNFQLMLLKELFDFNPIQYHAHEALKILNKNRNKVPSSIIEIMGELNQSLTNDMIDVFYRFEKQIHRLLQDNNNIEENENLQERIKKGCVYFSEKADSIILNALEGMPLDIKNASVKKLLKKIISRFKKEVMTKIDCLQACVNGFSVEIYLHARG